MTSDLWLLAIETSCDDTAVALYRGERLVHHMVSSQPIHSQYGGVIPEFAARAHLEALPTMVRLLFEQSGVGWDSIDAVAVTAGPGLIGSLAVGVSYAKGVAIGRDIPLVGVDHLHAHAMAHFIEPPAPTFPFLNLLVSGGHTQLMRFEDPLTYQIVGTTRDDAVGEAFDKAAAMLDLGYPGGPRIDRLAREGNPKAFPLPVARMPGYDFSYSGLKTALKYLLRDHPEARNRQADVAASFQEAALAPLLQNLRRAARELGIRQIGVSGGVAANRRLRALLRQAADEEGWQLFIPSLEYCTDNAAMVGRAALFQLAAGHTAPLSLVPYSRAPHPPKTTSTKSASNPSTSGVG